MSWARYCATRAREALQASDAAPLAARSWFTKLNSTPAAPPTVETGGAGGLGGGGAGRTATGAACGGAGGGATTGGGVGGGARPERILPRRWGRAKATAAGFRGLAATRWR